MDKLECLRLSSEAFINDPKKFGVVDPERPKTEGRPPNYYHPLLQKKKELESIVRINLPKSIADSGPPTDSQQEAHLYGLPKTHKERLAVSHPICQTDVQLWIGEMVKNSAQCPCLSLPPDHFRLHRN